MTTVPRFRYLAAGVLALSLAWAIGPTACDAEGQSKADFAIKTHVVLDESGLIWRGTWSMNGVVEDSGRAAAHRGYHGLDTLWLEGEAGSMTIGLVTFDIFTGERIDEFVVDQGTGVYETWVGASGTFHAHYGRTNGGHSLKGFLP